MHFRRSHTTITSLHLEPVVFSPGLRQYRLLWSIWIVLTFLSATAPTVNAATITVNASQTFQIIEGFGVNANHRSWTNSELKPVLDALIDQAGMTLFRVIYDNTDWESTNSSTSPDAINWNYYNQIYTNSEFQALWGIMGYLNQRGITNGVMVNFQGPGPQWMGGTNLIAGYENEWAKMIASLFIYARNTRHLQFTLMAPDNEPDLYVADANTSEGVGMSAYQYPTALHCLAQQLDTNGLSDVRFVGPDSASEFSYLWQIMIDPVVMAKMAHIGLHSYLGGGVESAGMYSTLQDPPFNGMTFWMTEFNVWCYPCEWQATNTYSWDDFRNAASYLLYHLANGASAGIIWEGYDSYYRILDNWSCWGLFAANGQYAAPKIYTPRKNFYTISQISRFVRPGAYRIGLSGSLDVLQLLAFHHPDSGQLTLTGVNPDGASVNLTGTLASLPAVSKLDLYYTDAGTNLAYGGTFLVTNGVFTASIPPDCVFTLTYAAASQTGSLQVTINPSDAVGAGAQWQVDHNGTWSNSGATVLALPVGSHTIAFKPISGWTTPSNQTVTVSADSTATATGTYVPVQAVYQGLFYDTNNVALQSSGFFTAAATSKGTLTAKLQWMGKSHSLSGQLASDGSFSKSIARKGMTSVTVSLQLAIGGDVLTGEITDGTWTAELVANRGVYSKMNPAPLAGNKYTLVIPGSDDSSTQPGGGGFATVNVNAAGTVTVSGTLGDAARFSQKALLSRQGEWPFYASLYSGNGAILGWITFTNRQNDDFNGLLNWFKTAQLNAKSYPNGFSCQAEAVGSTYVQPPVGTPALAFTNGRLWLENGNLPAGFTNQIIFGPNNKVTCATNKLSLSILPSTGLFKGSVPNPASGKAISVSGAVLQKQKAGYGYFPGTNQTGQVYLGP